MKAKVVDLKRVRGGYRLSLECASVGGKHRVCCRVSEEQYIRAGEPALYTSVNEEEYLLLAEKEEWAAAYERAVTILSMGDNSRRGLLQKLSLRGFLREAAEGAVMRLSEEGYLDEDGMLDRQFAIFAKKRLGMRKILPSLLQKGFSKEDVLAAKARAEEEGVYSSLSIKASLLEENAHLSPEEKQKMLKKHGFLA